MAIEADLVVAAEAGIRCCAMLGAVVGRARRADRHPLDAHVAGSDDPAVLLAYVAAGCILVAINCGTYYQCGYLIRKDSYDVVRAAGLEALRERLAR